MTGTIPQKDEGAIEGSKVVPEWGGCGGRLCPSQMSYILFLFFNITSMSSGLWSARKGYGPPPLPATILPTETMWYIGQVKIKVRKVILCAQRACRQINRLPTRYALDISVGGEHIK